MELLDPLYSQVLLKITKIMSIDEIEKPGQLTNQFVRQVHENQGDRSGYFQIVQFHQKRQKYYSTHISDGFYKCKVIFRQKPSKQIEKGEIKLFSIIHGTVSNQGNRILMIFNEVRSWDYSKTIGVIRSWKFQNRNLYLNGSVCIEWTQSKQPFGNGVKNISSDNENEDDQFNETEVNGGNQKMKQNKQWANKVQEVICEDKKYQNTPTFSFGSSINIFQNNLTNVNSTKSILQPTQSMANQQLSKTLEISKSKSQHINQTKDKDKVLLIVQGTQTQSQINSAIKNNKYVTDIKSKINMEEISERFSEVYSKKENSTDNKNTSTNFNFKNSQQKESSHKKKSNIWNFCLRTQNQGDDDLDDEQALFKQAKQIKQNNNQLEKKNFSLQLSQKRDRSKKQKSIFQLLYQQQDDQTNQKLASHIKSIKSNQKQKNTPKEPVKSLKTPLKISQSKNGTSQSDSDFELALQKSHQKTKSLFSLSNQVNIRQLNINLGDYQNCNYWVRVLVLSMRFLSESKMIVILENTKQGEQKCIFNMILLSADIYCPFEEGFLYQLSLMGVSISQPNVRQFKMDLQFLANSQDITARKIQEPQKLEKSQNFTRHPYYVEIEKISELKQVGLISRCKNFYNKKKGSGWTNIFTIIDPFSGSSIEFTIFDASKLSYDPGSPILVYNTLVKYYQGKITLISRNYTLCFIGKEEIYEKFSNFIPQLQEIRVWEEKGNKINSIVGKTQNFRILFNLLQIQIPLEQNDPSYLNVQTPVCRVIKISPFFLRIICDQCYKKMNNLISCFKCGRRQNPIKQVHLSIQVSDYSHTCYVQFNEYDSVGYIGQEGEKLAQFSENVMHKRVKLWLALNPKYKSKVIKMEIMEDNQQSMAKQMIELKEILKYI